MPEEQMRERAAGIDLRRTPQMLLGILELTCLELHTTQAVPASECPGSDLHHLAIQGSGVVKSPLRATLLSQSTEEIGRLRASPLPREKRRQLGRSRCVAGINADQTFIRFERLLIQARLQRSLSFHQV